jgi:WD40 repeat protein
MLRLETGMHTAPITRIGVDAAQRYLVTGSHDKTVRVWELVSGRLLRTLRPPIGAGSEGEINAVALSPDGSTIAAGGFTDPRNTEQSLYLFDRASGRLRQRITDLPNAIAHLAYARDGAFLVATLARAHGMRVYRSSDGAEVARDTAYGDDSYGADFDPSGRLVTTSFDGFVRLYDRDFRLRVKRQAPGGKRPFAVTFSPDGSRVAVGFDDSTRVDDLSGQDLTPLYAPDVKGVDNGDLSKVAWSADGQWLYAAGIYMVRKTRTIRRWAAEGRGPATNLPTAAQNTISHLLPLGGRRGRLWSTGPSLGRAGCRGETPALPGARYSRHARSPGGLPACARRHQRAVWL